jgi:hypothetical protein
MESPLEPLQRNAALPHMDVSPGDFCQTCDQKKCENVCRFKLLSIGNLLQKQMKINSNHKNQPSLVGSRLPHWTSS